MNVVLWKALASQLLKKHFLIELNDTRLSDPGEAERLALTTRPYEAVNQIADKFDLDRTQRSSLYPNGAPLGVADETEALVTVQKGMLVLSDQPVTCPNCGSRTSFDELQTGLQHHRCLNAICGNEFITCPPEDDEDDQSEAD